jgi:hypothetical protein
MGVAVDKERAIRDQVEAADLNNRVGLSVTSENA